MIVPIYLLGGSESHSESTSLSQLRRVSIAVSDSSDLCPYSLSKSHRRTYAASVSQEHAYSIASDSDGRSY